MTGWCVQASHDWSKSNRLVLWYYAIFQWYKTTDDNEDIHEKCIVMWLIEYGLRETVLIYTAFALQWQWSLSVQTHRHSDISHVSYGFVRDLKMATLLSMNRSMKIQGQRDRMWISTIGIRSHVYTQISTHAATWIIERFALPKPEYCRFIP